MEELRACGLRPRRHRSTGLESLTPRELQVLRAATAGRTNAEIAELTFISRRTVESHLASIFMKLGIHSRTELLRLRL